MDKLYRTSGKWRPMLIFNVIDRSLIVFLYQTRSIQHDKGVITDRYFLV